MTFPFNIKWQISYQPVKDHPISFSKLASTKRALAKSICLEILFLVYLCHQTGRLLYVTTYDHFNFRKSIKYEGMTPCICQQSNSSQIWKYYSRGPGFLFWDCQRLKPQWTHGVDVMKLRKQLHSLPKFVPAKIEQKLAVNWLFPNIVIFLASPKFWNFEKIETENKRWFIFKKTLER